MKTHPQIISQDGLPMFVVLSYAEYQQITQALDDLEDIEAIKHSKDDDNERFPLELVEKIASGQNPIAVFRAYRKMSQTELAKHAEVSKQYISQIEKNERSGTLTLLKKIAKILKVDLDDLT